MEKKRNNFLDGFVLGAVIGSAAVFLLGTKKGREVLQIVKEEGRERLGSLEDMFSIYHEAMDDEEMDVDAESRKFSEKTTDKKSNESKTMGEKEKPKSTLRRKLFKGLSKRKAS